MCSGQDGNLADNARLAMEQAAAVAHYKKMYERSSALARIGVWECDLATEALSWTDGVYDLFELPRGTPPIRADTLKLYEPDSRREMERLRAAAIAEGGGFTLDIHIRTAKGNPRWLRLTADVEREDGRAVRIFGTKQDITSERQAQEKLRLLQAEMIHVSRQSAMGAMVATLAHDLNQPLAAISNYVAGTRRALERDPAPGALVSNSLDEIEKNALRAGTIIRKLREMTRGSSLQRQRLNPNPIIREAAALAVAGSKLDIAFALDLADGVMLSLDPVQFQQALINIVRNACEALDEAAAPSVGIATAIVDGALEIRIEDNGAGIAPDYLPNLFESFISSKEGAMGVGLSISRTIVEAHGGSIAAANLDEGGARFTIQLPIGKRD